MPDSKTLLNQITLLQAKAAEKDEEIERARELKANAAGQLAALTERLEAEFEVTTWEAAEFLLLQLNTNAVTALADAQSAFAEAGI